MINKYFIWIITALVLCFYGCSKDLLNFQPHNKYTEGNYWKTKSSASRYLTATYAVLRSSGLYGGDATPLWEETASPNAYNKDNSDSWNSIAEGTQNASSGGIIAKRWSLSYEGIGRANTILKRIGQVPMNNDLKRRMEGEAHFLRALFYFNLEIYYGAVPLILDPPNPATQSKLPRTPREKVVKQILIDLDSAAISLPLKYSGNDIGRATKGAALALKAKVLLFEASPLYNPDKDRKRWGRADTAAKKVMDMADKAGYGLFPNYRNLFLPENENNKEVIFDVQFVYPHEGNSFDLIDRQYNNNAPLLNLVNAYYMKNGLPINNSASGYESNDPYKNRDPRLEETIAYPGDKYMGKTVSTTQFAITGFGMKKYSVYTKAKPSPKEANLKSGQSATNYIVLRYADILLMYAEAKNEFSGPDESIYNAIDKVRKRAGMPDISKGLSQDSLREIIRHERRIEFAGEGYYYNDIRRWKIADDVMNGKIYTWDSKAIETRQFNPDRDYWWPIPQDERDLNPNLKQNPNY
jgi:hypothetical protein